MVKRGDKLNYRGFIATVQMVWADDLIQLSFTDDDGNVHIVRVRHDCKCECGATSEGKWADVHHPSCSAVKAA